MARNYFAQNSELNWDVKPTEIIVNGKTAPNNFALVRSDNNEILDIHKNSYNPYYNVEFKSMLDDLQKITNFTNLTYQEYKGGRVILGYLENSEEKSTINGFDVNKYLVLGNTHDGSKGIFLGTSDIMLRCMNQFGHIIKSNVIRHTKNNFARIDDLKNAYEIYFKELEATELMYKKMIKINVDQTLLDSLTKRLFDAKGEEISTRKLNQILDFTDSYRKESKDLGENLFGFFHATTHYTTHKIKGENTFGNLFGTQNKLNQLSFDMCHEILR